MLSICILAQSIVFFTNTRPHSTPMVVPSAWSILALLSRATYRETPEAAAAHNSKMPELPQSFNQSTESLVFGFYKAHFELRLKLHLETTSATEDTDVLKLTDDELATVRALVDSPAFAPYSIDRLPAELRPVAMALIAYGQAHFRFKPRRLTQHTKFALEQARRAHTWHQEQQQPNNDETQTLETIVEVFFKNVSDSLFVDGIQWNFILTFLLFGAEFALQAVATKALTAAENVARWQTSYFNQQLGDWIVDNDGWVSWTHTHTHTFL